MWVARTSRLSVGCCSLPFAASVMPHRHRCWLHGPEPSVSRNVLPNRWTAPHLPHLRRAGNQADPTCFRATCCQVTSWQGESSSLEIIGCPSSGMPTCVHSTRASSGSDHGMVSVVLVPPLWSSTTSTVFSAFGFRAYCSSVPDMGFAGFLGSPSLSTEDDSDEVRIPTSAPPSEGLLLVGSRSPSLGSAPS